MIFALARGDVADYVEAVFRIYSIVVIAWILASLVFSLGVSVPYSRVSNAVLDFLRDCSEPYLRIFRRLGLRAGPFDLSPILALLALNIVASIVVRVIAG